MIPLKPWQWAVLIAPIALMIAFILVAAGWQIHAWGVNWIWALFTLLFVGWQRLLVKWTQPGVRQVEAVIAEVSQELQESLELPAEALPANVTQQQAEAALETILQQAQTDPPVWADWQTFWQRCQALVSTVAQLYHPEVKYPLLNIHIPQAYGLIRGTVDDVDVWMQKLSPVLNQMTIGQGVEAYQIYQQVEPSARKLWQAWSWAQWVVNPAAALARQISQPYANQSNQQLLGNLGQLLREAALRNLWRQAVALYSGILPDLAAPAAAMLDQPQTQTLREILAEAEPIETLQQKPINLLLIGRTGAGKSSLINTLFQTEQAAVDVLPNTDQIQSYQWQSETGETLNLWDTPGYEQIDRPEFRQQVLQQAKTADLLLLVTPALDPALQMDQDFLREIKTLMPDLPILAIVTQVDRLRPVREWQPPYDWQWGHSSKEVAIRAATQYRADLLGDYCDRVLPMVTGDFQQSDAPTLHSPTLQRSHPRTAWGAEAVATALLEALPPAQQFRLARTLRDRDNRTLAAAKIIDRYTFQMTTTQGLTALLKSPILTLLARQFAIISPALPVLAQQIPVEQVPIVIGKLQMGYELFGLFHRSEIPNWDMPVIWQIIMQQDEPVERSAWALGQALVEYWTKELSAEQFQMQYQHYLQTDR
ncbi:MAG: 50S ribosome-binding GTPase [Elainella sp. Prado103]|jgi:hypothetical protein|nr:50S ribosome-binding GTPase [Elainella sp. Prado103]